MKRFNIDGGGNKKETPNCTAPKGKKDQVGEGNPKKNRPSYDMRVNRSPWVKVVVKEAT